MKLEMHKNSLFAILMRSPWWVSAMVAAAVFGLVRFFLPVLYAVFSASPFAAIALYAIWKQLRLPSAAAVARKLESIRAQDTAAFAAALERGFRREGYAVTVLADGAADLELAKGGRTWVVAYKRWKVARAGMEPLRQLDQVRRAREAQEAMFVATAEVTEQARDFAARNQIQLLEGAELVRIVGPL